MSEFKERYKKLNKEQKEAVDTIDGPVMVVAGPGSGKTELLGLRVANILEKTDVYPSSILCLTFTESACNNMRERLHEFIGSDAYRVAIHTFHSFGTEIIRNHSEFFYNGASFKPADDLAQIELLREVFTDMDFDNPLNKLHPEQGYTYLKSVKSAITSLKKSGLTPEEFRKILEHNKAALGYVRDKVHEVMNKRLSKKSFSDIEELINQMRGYDNTDFPVKHMKPLLPAIADSLESVLSRAIEENKTSPISAWKTKNVKLNDDKKRVLKEEKYIDHMSALADIYEVYRKEMYNRGFIDFDDMLLDAISAIEKNDSLRYELQENFLYIMVDEFQDTNDAQVRLFHLLTDYDNIKQSPNIMVVGDDDQAIFKFQGARVSNVIEFRDKYKDTKFVTLKNNYRSSQDILDLATHVIGQGEERLENLVEEIEKELVAANPSIEKGHIVKQSFDTRDHEYRFIAREIGGQLKKGVSPGSIAVIARQHNNLEGIVPFLQYENIPIKYDRQQNILLEPHIYQIIQIARFVITLVNNREKEADDLLPEILSYPFWGIDRREIWEIALQVKSQKSIKSKVHKINKVESSWLFIMLESQNEKLVRVADFFLELREMSRVEPLEYVMDRIIGVTDNSQVDLTLKSPTANAAPPLRKGEFLEADAFEVSNSPFAKGVPDRGRDLDFVSPFREYYFSQERFQNARADYLKFLSSLNTFRNALREYKRGKILRLEDLVEFVKLHNDEGILITDTSSYINAESAVELLTAHKAKGLEFENVFVVNCQNEVWIGRGFPQLLPMPANLPITIAGDNLDDKLRLFFVAITRAKSNLYLTSYKNNAKGKESVELQFLAEVDDSIGGLIERSKSPTANAAPPLQKGESRSFASCGNNNSPFFKGSTRQGEGFDNAQSLQVDLNIEILQKLLFVNNRDNEIKTDEKALLLPLVEKYKMSVTHLNNFLNVTRGGPQLFLDQNLLHFPQAKSEAGAFGSAVHASLQNLYIKLQNDKKLMSERELLINFEEELFGQRLAKKSFEQYLAKGQNALGVYYNAKKDTFDPKHKIEFDFSGQGVVIGKARLSGKIDKMMIVDDEVVVYDYKTGKAKRNWTGRTKPEKIQLHSYRRQLVFYKILVENSRAFASRKVNTGVLEFIEPFGKQIIDLSLNIGSEETDRLKRLIMIVFDKIQKLDFPDVSKYSDDVKGIIQFEDDLLG
jgi:DNA helicase II / ATP-dependent DNA helicase PcrA